MPRFCDSSFGFRSRIAFMPECTQKIKGLRLVCRYLLFCQLYSRRNIKHLRDTKFSCCLDQKCYWVNLNNELEDDELDIFQKLVDETNNGSINEHNLHHSRSKRPEKCSSVCFSNSSDVTLKRVSCHKKLLVMCKKRKPSK